MAIKRRSIVEFEKWLQGEIAVATLEMQNMDEETAALEKRRAVHAIKLETLKSVAAKLSEQPPADEEQPALPDVAAPAEALA